MEGTRRIVQALLGIQITLAAIALALISTAMGAAVLLLALAGFAITGSALPGHIPAERGATSTPTSANEQP